MSVETAEDKFRRIISEVSAKPDWQYYEEFRHQAPHLSKSKFREEIYDYVEASATERDGINAAASIALKKLEEDFPDFQSLCDVALKDLRDRFDYLNSLPFGSPESPHMYKWGFKKVIEKIVVSL